MILDHILTCLPWMAAFSAIWILARLLALKKPSRLSHEAALYLLWMTVAVIISQTLSVDGTVTGFSFSAASALNPNLYNYVPFYFMKRLITLAGKSGFYGFLFINVIGNVAIFLPVGFCSRWAYSFGIGKATLFWAALSLAVELCQIPTNRNTDIDDLILNTAGAFAGALLFAGVSALLKKRKKDSPDE
ncbi:MAG: VanZ family protein [Clostridia bacterium]|nr:VanZ family protein [Clostridia bacterium]